MQYRSTAQEIHRTLIQLIKKLPMEDRLEIARLEEIPAEERLKGLTAEERLKGLTAEELMKGLTAEERLRGLTPAELDRLRMLLQQPQSKDGN